MAVSACGEGCHVQMEKLLPNIMEGILPYLKDSVSTDNDTGRAHLLSSPCLVMFLGSIYCKQYGPRSDSGLIINIV